MTEAKGARFLRYLPLLLEAIQSSDQKTMRPAEARPWIKSKIEVPQEDLTRHIKNGKQTIFENDILWARRYLAKANLVSSPRRG
jgi:restriction endonuclease Mrr